MKAEFHAIDMETWPRAQTYNYFTEMVTTTTYSITVTLDVTILRHILKSEKIKFFPTYLYLITRAIGKQQEFRRALQDGVLGSWDYLSPYYPVLHDDKTITFICTEYNEDFRVFYKNCVADMEHYEKSTGIMSAKAASNNYIIASIPWFSFNSLSMHLQNANNYYAPIFESGGFTEKDGETTMPLSITVNHAAIDGYHIKVFLEELTNSLNHPEEWL